MGTKYITTSKHPELKEGIVFKKSEFEEMYYVSIPTTMVYIHADNIGIDIEKGHIKELQEPEFTRDDMSKHAIDFLLFCYNKIPSHTFDYKKEYKIFKLKQRNNEK